MATPITQNTDRDIIIAIKEQTVIGTPATGAGGEKIRFGTSPGLVLETANVNATESRDDGVSRAPGLGRKQVTGTVNGPASLGSYNTLDAAVMRSAYSAAEVMSNVEVAGNLTLASGVLTVSAGDFIVDGNARVGKFFIPTVGFAAADLNKLMVITALTANTAAIARVDGVALTDFAAVTPWSISMRRNCIQGVTDCAFTVEQYRKRSNKSEIFEWVRASLAGMSLSPDGEVQRQFGFFGRNQVIGAAQTLTNPTESITEALQSARSKLIIDDSAVIGLSQFSHTLNLNPFRDDSVDELTSEIGIGQPTIVASVTVLEKDLARVQSYIDGDDHFIAIATTVPGLDPLDFEGISYTKAKFGAATPSGLGADRFSARTFPLLVDADLRGGAFEKTMFRLSDSL